MAARFTRLVVALGLLLGAALPSAAAAVVRLPASQETAASPVPDRGADPVYARSYFGARYYRAEIGRFTTVDPELNTKEVLADPQRWNRYEYARNNPLKFVDPDGKDVICATAACYQAHLQAGAAGAEMMSGVFIGLYNRSITLANTLAGLGAFPELQLPTAPMTRLQNLGSALGDLVASVTVLAGLTEPTPSVLGHYADRYVQKAQQQGAAYFSMSAEEWNALSPAEQWSRNRAFLDEGIGRGGDFILATARKSIRKGSWLAREVDYLLDHGYEWSNDSTRLTPKR